MLIKMTKMALVASLVAGATSAALANEFGQPSASPRSPSGVVAHRAGQSGGQVYGFVPASNRSIGITTGAAPMPCPSLEGYPDCH